MDEEKNCSRIYARNSGRARAFGDRRDAREYVARCRHQSKRAGLLTLGAKLCRAPAAKLRDGTFRRSRWKIARSLRILAFLAAERPRIEHRSLHKQQSRHDIDARAGNNEPA